MEPLTIAVTACITVVIVALLCAVITHKGPQAIQRAEAAAAHRAVVDAFAVWKAAVAADLADAAAATAKAQADAAVLAAFEASLTPKMPA